MFSNLAGKLCSLAAIAAGACATEASTPAGFDADTGPAAAGEEVQPRIVAQITTDEHAQITFYNERDIAEDPVISIAIASPGATPVLDAVLAQAPSALELFVALQPAQAAPDELARDHRLLARVDPAYRAEPRQLITASVAASGVVDSFPCAGNYAGWLTAFSIVPPLAGTYTALDSGTTTGYVGYAPRFYFDVCRVTQSSFGYVVNTERRSNSAAPWSVFDSGSPLGFNERYRFLQNSHSCTSFQWRLYVNPVGGSYYRGATWAEEFPCIVTS